MSTVVYQAYIGISFFPDVHQKKINSLHESQSEGQRFKECIYLEKKIDMCRGAEWFSTIFHIYISVLFSKGLLTPIFLINP